MASFSQNLVAGNTAMPLFLASGIAVVLYLTTRRRRNLPPGPKGYPVIGNVFDMPKQEGWKKYLEWGQQYDSDIIHMGVPGLHFFVLNSAEAITELLIKRSSTYADRPQSTLLKMVGNSWMMVFMNYTNRWKEHRRIFRREFESSSTFENRGHELAAARRLVKRLLTTEDYTKDIRLAAGDAILSVTYGITPRTPQDPFIRTPEDIMVIFADVAKGGYLVDLLPFLKHLPSWLPGVKFHKLVEEGKPLSRDMVMAPFEHVTERVKEGNALTSISSRFLNNINDATTEEDIEIFRNVMGIAYIGAADTTVTILNNFILAMALHPEVQLKAQAALAKHLQGERLPDFSDFGGKLPYMDALINEVLRWHPATPFAVYHAASQDDVYNGYDIPKGSIMIPNLYALLHQESVFGKDTEDFKPERFLHEDGTLNKDILDLSVAFGFGRRQCPGRVMGRDTVWMMAASILTSFDISDPVDLDGNPITSDKDMVYTNNMVSFSPPYKVKIVPRVSAEFIQDALTRAEAAL